jgi:hypothetical protein
MKWIPLILNTVVAVGFIAFTRVAVDAAHSVDQIPPSLHARRFEAVDFSIGVLGWAAAAACVINGLLLSRRGDKSLPTVY